MNLPPGMKYSLSLKFSLMMGVILLVFSALFSFSLYIYLYLKNQVIKEAPGSLSAW
jgi:vacuolar-type H+-ATPase subunit I/STV1